MDLFTKLFGDFLVFVYHCFDRIVIHGYLTALSRPELVVHFFREIVGVAEVSKEALSQRTAVAELGGSLRAQPRDPDRMGREGGTQGGEAALDRLEHRPARLRLALGAGQKRQCNDRANGQTPPIPVDDEQHMQGASKLDVVDQLLPPCSGNMRAACQKMCRKRSGARLAAVRLLAWVKFAARLPP